MGKKLTQIILHGGLGNQLFQWAFGHRIYRSDIDLEYNFITPRKNSVMHTKFSLERLQIPCSHGNFVETSLKSPEGLKFKLLSKFNNQLKFPHGASVLINSCNEPFVAPIPSEKSVQNRKTIYFGYFQNRTLIEENAKILSSELNAVIQNQSQFMQIANLRDMDVIHIRGYKMENKEYTRNYGVLNREYLKRITRNRDRNRVVITNDVQHAFELVKGLKIDLILGPSDLSELQCLALMAMSPRVYTANSTLSWWGGFLCYENGGEVIIPHPFYRNYKPNPGYAYQFKGFQTMASSFYE